MSSRFSFSPDRVVGITSIRLIEQKAPRHGAVCVRESTDAGRREKKTGGWEGEVPH